MLHGRQVTCAERETSIFDPPSGQTCGQYLAPLASQAAGTLQNPEAMEACRYCPFQVADQYLAGSRIYWGDRWRNYGIMWAFICFNIFIAVLVYYLFRVKKWNSKPRLSLPWAKKEKKQEKTGDEKTAATEQPSNSS
jgi:ABC-type multidrug transport system permease subunit